ncbi:MAG: hypothetical protein M5U28_00515 [Sandaracinaceae bacterium]|nr:hypothetical protein [Sandaracinaceae bacterium]
MVAERDEGGGGPQAEPARRVRATLRAMPALPLPELASSRRAFVLVHLALQALTVALAVSFVRDPDLGFHLANGRSILELGHIPATNVLTFAEPEASALQSQWLAAVLFELAYRALGVAGPTLLETLVVCATTFVLVETARALGARASATLLALALGTLVASERFVERPLVFSNLALAIVAYGAAARLSGAAWRRPAILAVGALTIGAHLHGGAVFGFLLLAALASVHLAAANERLARVLALPRAEAVREARAHALVLCAAVALTALSLFAYHPHAARVLTVPFAMAGDPFLHAHLVEFRPPSAFEPQTLTAYWLLAALVAVAVVGSIGRVPAPVLVTMAFGLALSLRHVRFVDLCALLGAPGLALVATRLMTRRERVHGEAVALALALCVFVAGALAVLERDASGFGWDPRTYPRALMRDLRALGGHGTGVRAGRLGRSVARLPLPARARLLPPRLRLLLEPLLPRVVPAHARRRAGLGRDAGSPRRTARAPEAHQRRRGAAAARPPERAPAPRRRPALGAGLLRRARPRLRAARGARARVRAAPSSTAWTWIACASSAIPPAPSPGLLALEARGDAQPAVLGADHRRAGAARLTARPERGRRARSPRTRGSLRPPSALQERVEILGCLDELRDRAARLAEQVVRGHRRVRVDLAARGRLPQRRSLALVAIVHRAERALALLEREALALEVGERDQAPHAVAELSVEARRLGALGHRGLPHGRHQGGLLHGRPVVTRDAHERGEARGRGLRELAPIEVGEEARDRVEQALEAGAALGDRLLLGSARGEREQHHLAGVAARARHLARERAERDGGHGQDGGVEVARRALASSAVPKRRDSSRTSPSLSGITSSAPSRLNAVWKRASVGPTEASWMETASAVCTRSSIHGRSASAATAARRLKTTWPVAVRFAAGVAPMVAKSAVDVVPTFAPTTMAPAADSETIRRSPP